MLPREVFLSHCSHDRALADRLAVVVTAHGVPVWYAPSDIVGAQQWHDEIGRALDRCDWLMVILSPQAVTSKWVKRELVFALTDDRYNDRIVPLLHQDCNYRALSWTLSQLQRVDFSRNFTAGCRDLLRIWGVGLRSDLLPPDQLSAV